MSSVDDEKGLGRIMGERAAYASDPALSRGRLHGTGASPTRSEFQRDRDRIIHSTAFRRLQHKTQVFLHHEGQHFRTRLTHTLEVSQMARSIARALALDENLAEAVALAHDLGHTPFGHAGERVLNEKLAEWGGFDHNMQAIRVVTRLESRYAEHDGLNLSWEALEGILKHNGPLVDREGRALRDDHPLPAGLNDIPASTDLMPWSHASLEAQAAAIADDIAYNSHDIDDALRAGLISIGDLVDVPLVGPFVREVLERWPDIERSRQAHEVQRRLITAQIEDVIAESERRIAEAGPKSADDVRFAGLTLIAYSPPVAEAERGLKRFLFDNVYRSEPVMEPVRRSQSVVSMLFDHYMAAGDMPGRWAEAARDAPDRGARARLVADFVAGMTDPYALEQHSRLFDGAGALG
ncbi:deoxyguanosinetriphosphate triphosphohydrolase [Devosia sp. ZB163]|uniref:deoxyguanosinetriphosphate triphosphohydrolase n=1 Tax=Devosia sp. ZB163 TaxID=3025938 RepID=UPI002362FEE6|nr:deoxyguanosinetriphosphate triphosphohydrolase [Devosia sp. ZB163]MDC9826010.1 deoxyguanosinetriphosphate triphosphohydrolase [Devosia sp. ZB163]